MQINVIKNVVHDEDDSRYDIISYKIHDYTDCCEGIKQLPNIDFFYKTTENTDNPLEEFNECEKDLGVMLEHTITYHDAWDYDDYGFDEDYYYKIDFCPCCGKKLVPLEKELNLKPTELLYTPL